MPVSILPEPPDPAAESRRRIHRQAELVNDAAAEIEAWQDEYQRLQEAEAELRERYAHFARNQGRNVTAAVFATLLPVATSLVDLGVLGPVSDVTTRWSLVPDDWRLPLRVAVPVAWNFAGYVLGAKLGAAFESRSRSWLLYLVPAAAYVVAMPLIAWFVGEAVFSGPQRLMLVPMTIVLSTVPVLSGHLVSSALDYLRFLASVRLSAYRQTKALRRARHAGRRLLRVSHRLAAAITEHHRQFNEAVEPLLTPLAQRHIESISNGGIRVAMANRGNLRTDNATPAQQATCDGTEGGSDGRQAQGLPGQAGAQASAVNGRAAHDEDHDPQLEYLREQLARRAQAEDAELSGPVSFSGRLP